MKNVSSLGNGALHLKTDMSVAFSEDQPHATAPLPKQSHIGR